MKTVRGRIILWLVLFIAGFLLGFVPEYLKVRDLRSQLENPRKTIETLKLQLQMSDLRDEASLISIEVSRQNYGLARDYAGQYYTRLNEVIESVQDQAVKKSLEELATTRESVMQALMTATPAASTATQPVVLKTFDVTRIK
jgi:hypothetical protein